MGVFKSNQLITAASVIGKLFTRERHTCIIFPAFKLISFDFYFLYVF